ncbi:hypothetical protein AMECASPLE_022389 [Ameca splendens]|uniref:Uncharacterized protein n=1 Tax=Ameca splendens TaxID=208324 RepID=A0ABV0XGZ3_9TELE
MLRRKASSQHDAATPYGRVFSFSLSPGLCYFRWNNLLRHTMNHGIWWAMEDTPDPSFQSGDKKDAFEGAFDVG